MARHCTHGQPPNTQRRWIITGEKRTKKVNASRVWIEWAHVSRADVCCAQWILISAWPGRYWSVYFEIAQMSIVHRFFFPGSIAKVVLRSMRPSLSRFVSFLDSYFRFESYSTISKWFARCWAFRRMCSRNHLALFIAPNECSSTSRWLQCFVLPENYILCTPNRNNNDIRVAHAVFLGQCRTTLTHTHPTGNTKNWDELMCMDIAVCVLLRTGELWAAVASLPTMTTHADKFCVHSINKQIIIAIKS